MKTFGSRWEARGLDRRLEVRVITTHLEKYTYIIYISYIIVVLYKRFRA